MSKREEMKSLISEYRNSGLSLKRFCTVHNESIHRVRYWIGKFNKESMDTSSFIPLNFPHLPVGVVELRFVSGTLTSSYYLYPGRVGERNGLSSAFGGNRIVDIEGLSLESLFSPYGFDKVEGSYASRNTTLLIFEGRQGSVPGRYRYFLSAFNPQSDYHMMAADRQDPLNGMGCSSLYPLVDTVLRQGEQIGLY